MIFIKCLFEIMKIMAFSVLSSVVIHTEKVTAQSH